MYKNCGVLFQEKNTEKYFYFFLIPKKLKSFIEIPIIELSRFSDLATFHGDSTKKLDSVSNNIP